MVGPSPAMTRWQRPRPVPAMLAPIGLRPAMTKGARRRTVYCQCGATASGDAGRRLSGINPADMSVGATVNHIERAAGAVAEHQHRLVRQIHAHYRLTD